MVNPIYVIKLKNGHIKHLYSREELEQYLNLVDLTDNLDYAMKLKHW